jgi:phosphoribosyl-ATP pyrophosphohydrolase/phosphoribosyl-AMP cyclohydrolase
MTERERTSSHASDGAEITSIAWGKDGLLPVIVQDRLTGEVRMLAYANPDALQRTLDSGQAHFYSRSRAKLWRKGEESGHTLAVHEVWTDCDADTLVYLVDPTGPTCHTGRATCFFRSVRNANEAQTDASNRARATLLRLSAELRARRDAPATKSYTRKLLDGGAPAIGAKLREEAAELAEAIDHESDERVVSEAADVVYHLLVGLLLRGTELKDVEAELARRFGTSGIAEKASRHS